CPSPPRTALRCGRVPDAGDDDPLAGSDLGALECLVDGDAGAQQGRDLIGVGSVGDRGGEARVDEHVFAEGSVDSVAAVDLLLTQRLPALTAVLTGSAGRPQP